MATNSTLLCIHRNPSELSQLQQHYELVTATSGHEGLLLFMTHPVDAIVLDHQLGRLDGGVVAAAIKKVKPSVPIVMLAGEVDLPEDALQGVDALVAESDGPITLLETVHSVLSGKAAPAHEGGLESPAAPRHLRRSWDGVERRRAILAQLALDLRDVSFSEKIWRSIRRGVIRF
jgi:CheY-like chemotaxis protein